MAQVPVMPYLVDKLGAAGSSQYARLQTVFSAVQFVGGLISGPLMDRYGGRFLLAVSFAASMACYGLTASASNLWMLYLSRLPTVLQHAVLAARAIVTQLSSEDDRARVLGYVAVSYSVGFTVGPAIGGLLSSVSLQFAAWVATLGSALSLATVLLLLPDLPQNTGAGHEHQPGAAAGNGSAHHAGEQRVAKDGTSSDGIGGEQRKGGGLRHMLMAFVEVARRPGLPSLLAGKVLVGLGGAVYTSMFPVLLQRRYGLDPKLNGMVMSYVGVLLLAGQGLLVGPVIAALGEPRTELLCVGALVATYAVLAGCGSLWQVLVLMVPLSLAGMLYNNASTSRLTKAVLPQQRGTALAVDMSFSSGVRMLSPALGSAAFDQLGHRSVPALSAALVGCFLLAVQLGIFAIPVREGRGGAGSEEGTRNEGEGEARDDEKEKAE
ncbi:hypothetical protein GPECTOR_11g37 [Gonium pectorale]|uniref:Major facilitator superfamily (MFS) profile domain-containing protein n=1 Tax=Gonium pectorale TaxID=33097 RepID=A0A150GQ00_GONPE|nr:hypothetical protein GPECTOR_11g37 [Gonium pectorale]|eukprot:KXZ51909.1 hypothetical protein GPECTOR_11g37 [Gonium pectorale]